MPKKLNVLPSLPPKLTLCWLQLMLMVPHLPPRFKVALLDTSYQATIASASSAMSMEIVPNIFILITPAKILPLSPTVLPTKTMKMVALLAKQISGKTVPLAQLSPLLLVAKPTNRMQTNALLATMTNSSIVLPTNAKPSPQKLPIVLLTALPLNVPNARTDSIKPVLQPAMPSQLRTAKLEKQRRKTAKVACQDSLSRATQNALPFPPDVHLSLDLLLSATNAISANPTTPSMPRLSSTLVEEP